MFIQSIDRTKPLGQIVGEYGDSRWKSGFFVGLCVGTAVGVAIAKLF
jgi:hypothetical protein